MRNHLENILLPAPKHQVGLLLLLFLLLLLGDLLRLALRQVRAIVSREGGPGDEVCGRGRGWPRGGELQLEEGRVERTDYGQVVRHGPEGEDWRWEWESLGLSGVEQQREGS